MDDLISRQEMLNRLEEWNTDDPMDKALYNFAWNRIIEQPTIEPEWVGDPDRIYTELSKVYNMKGLSDEVYSIIGDLMISLPDVPERKKGKWIKSSVRESMLWECDQCGYDCGAHSFNFCPNCGADMRGDLNR